MSDNAQRESAAVEPNPADTDKSGVDAARTTEVEGPETETLGTATDSDEVTGAGGPETTGGAEGESPESADAAEASTSEAAQGGSDMAAEAVAASPSAESKTAKTAARKAHLTLSRIEPWSVMKFSFIISLVCFIILFVAVAVLYTGLEVLGVFDAVTELITSLTEGDEVSEEFIINPEVWFSPTRILGYTALFGALNVILITALATAGAMLYNLSADLVGGIDVTLSETE
ncbi:hypothetical protein TM51_00365 [Thermobifida fusca TM51]|jgi:hypothetical protein|uniref:DUF3566 domain-containing protein n=1 Tax=Thermobifida fusca TM51 TaxID=1169414 RepID=A0A9P2TDY4_THEFU|nr:DUF3566 domain-containing protein [Thermobifida fusca]EOR72869.1 hypothetical protein TM51_00365 [Thermobifida fusca TM51]QOS60409.1 DUF3566 domain-containing protein [Thermobifida fusca]